MVINELTGLLPCVAASHCLNSVNKPVAHMQAIVVDSAEHVAGVYDEAHQQVERGIIR